MLNRASMDRTTGGSQRNSLRNSRVIDDRSPPQMASVLYDQLPHRHGHSVPMAPTFLNHNTPETDLDDPEHIAEDSAMFMSQPHDHVDDEVFMPQQTIMSGSSPPLNVYHPEDDDDDLMYGLIEEKLMNDEQDECAQTGYRQMGIYGWRKKIIYLLLAVIVLLVGINAALTFWIVSFLGFSSVSKKQYFESHFSFYL